MQEQNGPSLKKHRLHFGELKVNENVFGGRFRRGCATSQCKASCCGGGVWVDLSERDRILENAELIRNQMEPGQEKNQDRWFDGERLVHADFPSGEATGTAVRNGACVFLDSSGKCVLQKASQSLPIQLKPWFCFAFPLTIDGGELVIDEGFDPDCCAMDPEGVLNVFEVCSEELKHLLGTEGLHELEQVATRPPATQDSDL